MSSEKNRNILSIGGAYVDINASNFPFDDSGIAIESEPVGRDYEVTLGGSAVNIVRFSAILGMNAAFIGRAGKDTMGNVMGELFRNSGIEPHLDYGEDVQTNVSFNMVNDKGQTIYAVVGTANQSLDAQTVLARTVEILPKVSDVFIGGVFKQIHLLDVYLELVAKTRDAGVRTILDHARLHGEFSDETMQKVRDMAKAVDVYLPSHQEFLDLWGFQSVDESLQSMAKDHGITVVKDGANGSFTIHEGKLVNVPAFSVPIYHTVGAGDSFNAGFILSYGETGSVLDSMRFGNAAAALKLSNGSMPTRDQLDEFIRLHPAQAS